MLKEIIESIGNYASPEEIKDALKQLKGNEQFRVAVMNRERTNYDTNWQRDYFYGDLKKTSKGQAKLVVNGMIELERILKKSGIEGRVSTENLMKVYIGKEDPKKYFKNMK